MIVSRFIHSGNAKNDDLLFPSLLPSMLSCLKGSSENQTVSRSQYCVVVCKSFIMTTLQILKELDVLRTAPFGSKHRPFLPLKHLQLYETISLPLWQKHSSIFNVIEFFTTSGAFREEIVFLRSFCFDWFCCSFTKPEVFQLVSLITYFPRLFAAWSSSSVTIVSSRSCRWNFAQILRVQIRLSLM